MTHSIAFRRSRARACARGTTLLEVLVAVLVFSLGLLGVAGLQAASLRYVQGGWARAAVAGAMSTFAELVRSNPGSSATAFALGSTYAAQRAAAGSLAESSSCDTANCSPDQLAALQLNNWQVALNNTLPGAAAFVTGTRSTGYQTTIIWFDRTNTQKSTTTGAESLVAVSQCTGSESGMAERNCCPAAAAVPAGGHCTNVTVLP